MSPIRHDNRSLDSVVGKTIFEYADTLRVRVPTSCNRSGECHECIVEIRQGEDALNSPTHEEAFLRDNYRLACQAHVTDPDADVEFVILRRQPRILTQTIKRSVPHVPSVTHRDDGVYFHDDRIDSYKGRIYGLAIDVGTTTVVMNLVDLESGDVLHTASFENPQRFGGSDIMHRISYDGGEFHGELQQVMLSSLNFEIGWMARELGFHRRNIYEVVIVGTPPCETSSSESTCSPSAKSRTSRWSNTKCSEASGKRPRSIRPHPNWAFASFPAPTSTPGR